MDAGEKFGGVGYRHTLCWAESCVYLIRPAYLVRKELKSDEETRKYDFAAFKMKYHSSMPWFSLRICISGMASSAPAEDAPLRAKSKGPGMRRVEVETMDCD